MADSTGDQRRRVRGRPWQPGQSGNPGGRIGVPPQVRELARQWTEAAISALAEITTDRRATPSARTAAAVALLDRGWGRPELAVSVTSGDGGADVAPEVTALRAATVAALAALAGRVQPPDAAQDARSDLPTLTLPPATTDAP